MKLDALVFLRLAFEKHPAVVVQPFVPKIFDQVSSTMSEDWYKIVSEVLRLLGTIVDVMRPIDSSSGFFIAGFDYEILAPKIYKLLLPRLEASDIDQEIKECAILTAGKLFASTADVLGSELDTVLHLLQKKLENETTRIAVLKTLIILSKSPLCLDLSKVLISSANEMAMYLRQQSRVLRQLTLQTLDLLVLGSKADIGEISSTILAATAALINDSDLYLCQLAMKLSFSALSKNTLVLAAPFYDNVYPALIALARSSLLKGISLETLANTLRQLVSLNLPGMTFIDLFSGLYLSVSNESLSGNTLEKQGLTTSSKCVAAITIDLSEPVSTETIQKFASDLLASNDTVNQLALLCLGEVGQLRDLSSLAGLKEVILQCFENPCEETKLCAAYALGHISVGNMKEFLPVVTQPSTSSKHQYLLLVSLKEIILFYANRNLEFSAYLNLVLPILLMQCKSSEESVRNMVAECLGLLLAINSQQMLSVLLQLLQESQDNFSRSMVAGAVRVCLSRPLHCDTVTLISEVIANFLTLLHDSDLEVKKAALLMVNAAVHHNAEVLITQLSSSVLPVLIETLKIKMERTVDFGPFKHKVQISNG